MPQQTVTPIQGYAHCANYGGRCPGYEQQPVDAILEETGWMYTENGGDLNMVERSQKRVLFADESDADCPSCGHRRDVSDQVRKVYDEFIPGSTDNNMPPPIADPEVTALREQVAQLAARLEKDSD